ncbi:hypothetical protein [Nonomuraea gerenzanensis]|uniref:Integral membrane protein n=1 Tax=Nonomuraea gerenzanensis TaxID=93944 RepID=A0A1M4DWX0_9ACTN|nr:hypothetical protein [Nonomuraea gerenzanensis]UBU13398.1 hypothetical protein LCN96_55770 [Nonomuraea gerenzanensis]SBO91058.1 hypothetical protein BN4615_P572 [Nonomuraea gerenzanensis]
MPASVSVARLGMWVQAVMGLVGVLLLFVLLGSAPPGAVGAALLIALSVPLATILLIGFLALRIPSRRGWVRVTGIVVELLLVLLGLWQLTGAVSFGNVLGVLLAGLVFAQLCRAPSATWFDR